MYMFSRLGILVSLRPIFLCNFQFLVCDVHIYVCLYMCGFVCLGWDHLSSIILFS